MSIETQPIVWVDDAAQLTELCHQWQSQTALAIDTEFMRVSTFYPEAGLVQVGDGKAAYLIDPLVLSQHDHFRQLLVNPAITKVLHSCSEDLEVFQRSFGVCPSPLFDTQIAAAMAGYGFSIGYANLVQTLLEVELPKDATRSDWLQRPLTDAQKRYAALDVTHLLVIYETLLTSLKASDRLSWVMNECALILQNVGPIDEVDPEYFRKVKLAWKLRPAELVVLKALSHWREMTARAKNIPRNHLMKENVLFNLAKFRPTTLGKLSKVEGMPSKTIREYGDVLVAMIKAATELPASDRPQRLPPPLSPQLGDLVKGLKALVREESERLKLPPELLVKKKDYEAIVRSGMNSGSYRLPPSIEQTWRNDLIGSVLLTYARAYSHSD
ncbi:ribonuclease D [Marinibactrum halimedae]|uniref:Ribonuclease D n=1 Tax=Marinibactrum halimedae TaxID=1444977 RepID=A0AA37T779_9GAMM|nr:ribonuclease D [Marinibactrum halimedae]MCD9457871.1 ribonuclease D [Marinibactrum halimedae]GLS26308.1 ribonuclease D [Marinibactrum halimedae]